MITLCRRTLGLSPNEATFGRRGFLAANQNVRERLERVGRTFIVGYNEALNTPDPKGLACRLNGVDNEVRGFAFEGAAMALTLLDHLTPWNQDRLIRFLDSFGKKHIYMIHVGIGWAVARLPWLRGRVNQCLTSLDPLLGWLMIDGYGFHHGYFHWRKYIGPKTHPAGLSQYAKRVFDQGFGRSLWFVCGADVPRIKHLIDRFEVYRQSDLWSGIGLACAYAGGADEPALERLCRSARPWKSQLAQGAAFAAKTREVAGNSSPHTELACRILCGLSAPASARITDLEIANLSTTGDLPAYEVWRLRIQSHF